MFFVLYFVLVLCRVNDDQINQGLLPDALAGRVGVFTIKVGSGRRRESAPDTIHHTPTWPRRTGAAQRPP